MPEFESPDHVTRHQLMRGGEGGREGGGVCNNIWLIGNGSRSRRGPARGPAREIASASAVRVFAESVRCGAGEVTRQHSLQRALLARFIDGVDSCDRRRSSFDD